MSATVMYMSEVEEMLAQAKTEYVKVGNTFKIGDVIRWPARTDDKCARNNRPEYKGLVVEYIRRVANDDGSFYYRVEARTPNGWTMVEGAERNFVLDM